LSTPTSSVSWSLAIAPVQQWIAEARRSRDLLAGSAILSWLMARLLRRVLQADGELTLPELTGEDLEVYAGELFEVLRRERLAYGIPNRASGILHASLDEAETLFGSLEQELASGWEEIRGEVARSARQSARELWAVVGPQVAGAGCPFQALWCVAAGEEHDLEPIDRLFAGVKRARRIAPHQGGAPVPKCGQCGRREAAGGADPADWRRFQSDLEALPEVRLGLRIGVSETLCPVCLTKRFAGYLARGRFPSTSEVAARDWLAAVRSIEDLRSLLRSLEDAGGRVPGFEPDWVDRAPLLFRRSIRRELRAAAERPDAAGVNALEEVERARRKLAAAIQAAERADGERPIPQAPAEYLAVVVFDGDDMGRRVRELRETLPPKVAEFQGRLAQRVNRPGAGAEGDSLASAQPFYLGGDEGLLLAPAASALELAHEVRELWREAMEPLGENAPTLSLGIALFDRERPLGPAIATARAALDKAKERPGKDGLGVTCVTASGSRWTAVREWGRGWEWARQAAEALRSGRLARAWPHDVERFLRSLPDAAWSAAEFAPAAIRREVERLTFRRAVAGEGKRREAGEEVWRRLGGDRWWPEVPPPEDRRQLADQLHVVAFLSRLDQGAGDAA